MSEAGCMHSYHSRQQRKASSLSYIWRDGHSMALGKVQVAKAAVTRGACTGRLGQRPDPPCSNAITYHSSQPKTTQHDLASSLDSLTQGKCTAALQACGSDQLPVKSMVLDEKYALHEYTQPRKCTRPTTLTPGPRTDDQGLVIHSSTTGNPA